MEAPYWRDLNTRHQNTANIQDFTILVVDCSYNQNTLWFSSEIQLPVQFSNTIWRPVWFSKTNVRNGHLYRCHLKTIPVFRWHSNMGPFDDLMTLDQSNNGLVQNADPLSIQFSAWQYYSIYNSILCKPHHFEQFLRLVLICLVCVYNGL